MWDLLSQILEELSGWPLFVVGAIIAVIMIHRELNAIMASRAKTKVSTADAAAKITDTVIDDMLVPLREELARIRAQYDNLCEENEKLRSEVQWLRNRVEALEAEARELETQRLRNRDCQDEIERLRARVVELEAHVEHLEDLLAKNGINIDKGDE